MRKYLPTLACFTILFVASTVSVQAGNRSINWNDFLTSPNFSTFVRYEALLDGRCDVAPVDTDHSAFQPLLKKISAGNSAVFLAMTRFRSCMGGGALEDFYRATGSYVEAHPNSFIEIVAQEKVSAQELAYMVTMLPLSTVDYPKGRLEQLKRRLKIISLVNLPALDETVKICRNALIESINE